MNLINIYWDPNAADKFIEKIESELEKDNWLNLSISKPENKIIKEDLLPLGPGIILESGGSSGQINLCLHSFENLNMSAIATAEWLDRNSIDPKLSIIFNPLPMNHISGLMPWWRSMLWGAKYIGVTPSEMKNPNGLEKNYKSILENEKNSNLISLVPTQLKRLMDHADGIKWLKAFDVIWIGGAGLSNQDAAKARKEGIRLSPCYGSSETAAMISALNPDAFLSGINNCGHALKDINLSLNNNGILKIKTPRLAIGLIRNGSINKLTKIDGWWLSSDYADLSNIDDGKYLKIFGRVDNAINSGGEIVYPEELEVRLIKETEKIGFDLKSVLFINVDSEEWGQRLSVLFRCRKKLSEQELKYAKYKLNNCIKGWKPSEKPISWYECPELETNPKGKWERGKWLKWLDQYTKDNN